MLDLVRERIRIVAVAVAIIVTVVVAKTMLHSPSSDPTGQSDALAARHQAEDVGAQTVLQQASIAMETVFAQSGSFAGGAAAAAAAEPNVIWTAGGEGDASANTVAVVADSSSYLLSARSASGVVYTYAHNADGTVTKGCGPGCSW